MKYWQLEQSKDIRISGPSGSINSSNVLSSSGENSVIREVVATDSSNIKIKFICDNISNSQKSEEYFVLEGLTEFGKKSVEVLLKDYSKILKKTIADFRNMEI